MHKFYFNECLPSLSDGINLQGVFENTIKEFSELLSDESLKIEKSVITHTSPGKIKIHGMQFDQLMNKISDKDYKTDAFHYFTRYPIDANCTIDEELENELIEKNHNFLGLNAINLAIAQKMKWFLYTLPVDYCLKKDKLQFNSGETLVEIENWYGEEMSSDYIRQVVKQLNTCIESKLDELKSIFEKCFASNSFEKDFRSSHPDVQRLIIEKFIEAKNSNMLFPVTSDDNLIKKCQGKGNESTYELRFGAFGGIRVYFTVNESTIYIGGMGRKSSSVDKEQSADIRKASNEIKKIKLTIL